MSAGHLAAPGRHHLLVDGDSVVHRMAPEAKIASLLGFVVVVALTPRTAPAATVAAAGVLAGVVAAARLPGRLVLVRLTVVVPFVAFAAVVPFVAGGAQVRVLGVDLSTDGLWGTWNIWSKAVLGTGASIVLAATTSVPDLLRGAARLHAPAVMVAIAAVMVRSLDVTVDQLGRMRRAMTARGHDPRWLWQARPIAASAGALFVRSYERSERVHQAMLARGFTGTVPELDPRRAVARDWRLAAVPPVIAAAALLAVLGTTR